MAAATSKKDPTPPAPAINVFSEKTCTKRECVQVIPTSKDRERCGCGRRAGDHQYLASDASRKGSFLSNQLSKIDVYYQAITIIEYSETTAYPILELLLDLSDIVDLLTGISVLSVFEVIYVGQCCKKKPV